MPLQHTETENFMRNVTALCCTFLFAGCASSSGGYVVIRPAEVPYSKYETFTCEQLEYAMAQTGERTQMLIDSGYQSTSTMERVAAALGGFGAGVQGRGIEYAEQQRRNAPSEYQILQGEFNSMRYNAIMKGCGFDSLSPEDIINQNRAT